MRVWNYLSAQTSRRALIAVGLVAMMGTSVAQAQTPAAAAQAPAAAAPAPADPMKLDSDVAIIVYVVKPDKGADFEAAWGQIKQLYASVEDPGLKAVGASLKLMKPTSLPPTAGLQYWFFVDPVFKDTSYDFVKIVYYVKPGPDAATPGTPIMKREDQDALWNKLKDCIQGINPIKFTKIGG